MKKIILIGSGGAGKSTLARRLGESLQINVYHLDAIFWKPNWIGTPKDEQIAIQKNLIKRETWIIDGNYGSTMEMRMEAADTIIFLDLPRRICLYRAFKRSLQYRNKKRPDMGEGCKERLSFTFFKWIWDFPKTQKPIILNHLTHLSTKKGVMILKSPKDIEKFLEKMTLIND